MMKKKGWFSFGKRGVMTAIVELATKRGETGGLFKRIDENRELLQLLQEECPTFLREHRWIEGWIRGNDSFFTELRAILDLQVASNDGYAGSAGRQAADGYVTIPGGRTYPRGWPEREDSVRLDELAALRKAVALMGFDSERLSAFVSSDADATYKAILLSSLDLDEDKLEQHGASNTAEWRKVLAGLRKATLKEA
ncbi:hypothetical protein G3A40_37435 [Paraburkholderia aspalathi]|uniref:hypothetical protein n=1 Tax=Paraburkholderia aspalathi TaxID=1324617 RepID=UPI001909F80E|nr:hypothetical protein [Paraburkholderia aspalathi]MBK3865430.1 hypothetical protein [Paraburkholderia aspalathi]